MVCEVRSGVCYVHPSSSHSVGRCGSVRCLHHRCAQGGPFPSIIHLSLNPIGALVIILPPLPPFPPSFTFPLPLPSLFLSSLPSSLPSPSSTSPPLSPPIVTPSVSSSSLPYPPPSPILRPLRIIAGRTHGARQRAIFQGIGPFWSLETKFWLARTLS